jgi:hypothetical protein
MQGLLEMLRRRESGMSCEGVETGEEVVGGLAERVRGLFAQACGVGMRVRRG